LNRIGFVTTSVVPNDGWGRYSCGVITSISALEECVVVTNSSDNGVSEFGYYIHPIRFLDLNFLKTLQSYNKIKRTLKGCELVHGLNEKTIGLLLYLKLTTKKKIFLTLHGTYAQVSLKVPFTACIKLLTYLLADGITSGSQHTINSIPLGSVRKKIRFIPNGVDTTLFFPTKAQLPRDYFLFVGALKYRKGPDILLEALAMAESSTKLILVGDQGNVRFFKELKSKIDELDIHDKVEFREFIGEYELLNLYQNAISVVLPARITKDSFEGFPMVIFEANAAGTPVISTRGFGADYAIVEGKNGFLIEQESVFQLAAALIKAQQLNCDSGMQESCLKVASDHDWKKIGVQIMDFYK